MSDNIPQPSNREAEWILLYAVVDREEAFDQVAPHVTAADWATPWMSEVAAEVWKMRAEGVTVDAGSVAARVGQHIKEILNMVEEAPVALDVEVMAKEVAALARVRRLAAECQAVAREASRLRTSSDAAAWLADADRRLNAVATSPGDTRDTISRLPEVIAQDLAPRLTNPHCIDHTLVRSEIPFLDAVCMMRRGALYTLAGTTGSGKSALACAIASAVAVNGGAVVYLSLEMPRDQLAARMAASLADVSTRIMTAGHSATTAELQMITEAFGSMNRWPLAIDEREDQDPSSARAAVRRAFGRLRRHLPKAVPSLIVVDHIHLMRDPTADRRGREQEVSRISNACRRLAREWRCPVLQLAQLSRSVVRDGGRDGKPRAPQLSDLRDSGSIEQDSFAVWMLEVADELTGEVLLHVRKNRDGNKSTIPLTFDGANSRFRQSDVPRIVFAKSFDDRFEDGGSWHDHA